MLTTAAGAAGFILVTGILTYVAYSIGVERASKKWKAEYSKLYRTCLMELMHAYSTNETTPRGFLEQKSKESITKTDGNVLKFKSRKEKDDSKN